jgi:hypothetical protein
MKITIKSRYGQVGDVLIDREEWARLSPAGKVLAIHAKGRHITQGQPFDIVSIRHA